MIRLIDSMTRADNLVPDAVRGKEVAIVSVGDPDAFASGREGAYCRIVDGTNFEGGATGRPYGSFYVDQMDDEFEAVDAARRLAAAPVAVVDVRPYGIVTTRGPLSIQPITFADGRRHPRMLPEPLAELVATFVRAVGYPDPEKSRPST